MCLVNNEGDQNLLLGLVLVLNNGNNVMQTAIYALKGTKYLTYYTFESLKNVEILRSMRTITTKI